MKLPQLSDQQQNIPGLKENVFTRTKPIEFPQKMSHTPNRNFTPQLTLLILLVFGSVWLMCRSVYLSGLLMSHGTDSVRTKRATTEKKEKKNSKGRDKRRDN